jgi:hypothetical protein
LSLLVSVSALFAWRRLLCASRNDDFNFFYSVLAGPGLRDRTAKIAEEAATSARAPEAGVQNSAVFCARSASTDVVAHYFRRA